MTIQLQFLGLPRVCIDGRVSVLSWQRQTLTLLTYLFTATGPQARDDVAFAIWPDEEEEAARTLLRRNLNQLRSTLPALVADWIVAPPGSIEFRHAIADTDVAEFESAAERGDFQRAARVYRGDFAASAADPWVIAARERLRARFHLTLGELLRIEFSARRFEAALAHARRIISDEPLREDIVRRMIAIRYAMGDRPGALAQYDRFAASLRADFDIDPMPETTWLRELIVRGDELPFAPDAQASPIRVEGGAPPAAALLPFIGRQTALARLGSAWDEACRGRGNLVVVRGEAGIGKTRLIAEFLEHTVGMSGRILRGTTASPEARPTRPYWRLSAKPLRSFRLWIWKRSGSPISLCWLPRSARGPVCCARRHHWPLNARSRGCSSRSRVSWQEWRAVGRRRSFLRTCTGRAPRAWRRYGTSRCVCAAIACCWW